MSAEQLYLATILNDGEGRPATDVEVMLLSERAEHIDIDQLHEGDYVYIDIYDEDGDSDVVAQTGVASWVGMVTKDPPDDGGWRFNSIAVFYGDHLTIHQAAMDKVYVIARQEAEA